MPAHTTPAHDHPLATREAPGLVVTVTRRHRTTAPVVVRAEGEVDTATAPVLAAALRAGCAAARPGTPLVLDLTGLRFLAAAGLTPVVETLRRCEERGVPLRVAATHRAVLRTFRVTGLDALLEERPGDARTSPAVRGERGAPAPRRSGVDGGSGAPGDRCATPALRSRPA